ncbi:PASTA domain-containing protein [bacterium]|nr:PASTA domain-containing protein [bacterium]
MVFLILFYISLNFLMGKIIHNGKDVVVPNLIGSNLENAYKALMEHELYLQKEGKQFNSNIPKGNIISQKPLPGTMVKPGRSIRVIISSGSEKIVVPDLVGKPERKAEIILRQSGLSLGDKTESYSVSLKKGLVIMHDPEADTHVEKGTPISLLISKGLTKHGALMPDFIGEKITMAERIVSAMGLSIEDISTEVNDDLEEGTIIEQSREPNTIVHLNNTLSFVITVQSKTIASYIKEIYFEVSQGLLDKHVRIIVSDKIGDREVYNKMQEPGSKIDIDVPVKGKAKAYIYINEVLVSEREL